MEQLPKLVRRGLQAAQKPGLHPDPDLLAAFAEKSLRDGERSQVLQHLAECADCREVLALAMPAIETAPSPRTETSPWLSWPMLRWGALAACVIVVSAAVTMRYERRQSAETVVAKKAPATSRSPVAEGNPPEPSREKLAAKITPPTTIQMNREVEFSGKLAKQSEKGLSEALVATRAGAPRELDQKVEAQTTNGRLSEKVAADSADQPVPPAGTLVASAPAPVPAARKSGEPQAAESQNKVRSEAADRYVGGASASTVEITSSELKAKDESTKNESQKEFAAVAAQAVGGVARADRKPGALPAPAAPSASSDYAKRARAGPDPPRWTLSADGVLQRSFDSGQSWQTIPVANNVVFRSLAANDSDIWVGGAGGALYHSSDAGEHWAQVKPVAGGKALTSDIVRVEFSDPEHGKVTTSNSETWTTGDAGHTWQRY